jgi:hypothetical protein
MTFRNRRSVFRLRVAHSDAKNIVCYIVSSVTHIVITVTRVNSSNLFEPISSRHFRFSSGGIVHGQVISI